ncbi:STAS domain-containing protein [Actinomadura flavalba]|uniref:STAS domain-containing protein n=1 Tax=Actinomadura flavalba TaxID=1120938 RepID=UPI00036B87D2|nr:STAS domain-containing protein [Actinomadura flavalba]
MAEENTTAARRPLRRGAGLRCRAGAPLPGAQPATVPQRGLEITLREVRPDLAVAVARGEIDVHTADTLRARLIEAHAGGHRGVVVDFADVLFCDAAGLGALVAAHNHVAERGGHIRLARMRPAQERLVRITRLHRLFALHDSLDEALTEAARALP